jgi:hypothetical protein
MAGRTSATIFATIFDKLAEDPTEQHRQWALEFWEESDNYDFSPSQRGCDEALQKLGLARRGVNPRHKEGGEVLLYRGCHGAPEWPMDLPKVYSAGLRHCEECNGRGVVDTGVVFRATCVHCNGVGHLKKEG